MLAARLWQLPQLSVKQLISNVICVTFAQPFIQSDLISVVSESLPDFAKGIHALRIEKDSIPFILGQLDVIACSDTV